LESKYLIIYIKNYLIKFRKRWLLFPPDSPIGELQTRIPYEESSVYLDIQPSILDKFKVKLFICFYRLKYCVFLFL